MSDTPKFSAAEIARLNSIFGSLDLEVDPDEDQKTSPSDLSDEDIAFLQDMFGRGPTWWSDKV